MGFDKDFLWGAASAAYQIEGAYDEDGKGMGIWDALSYGHVRHNENGNTACDHYHRYKEDIALMKQMCLKSYRFSVSWPRIMPEEGKINEKGIQFYKNLVSELLKAGIKPMCTLFHWNLPMWVYEKGGWLCDEISDYFAEYVKVVTEVLSDNVSVWMTLNEIPTFIGLGYFTGVHASFEKSPQDSQKAEERICRLTKNVLLAHGKAVRVIRECAKTVPQIGIAMNGQLVTPGNETDEAIEKARNATFPATVNCGAVNWWLDPIIPGTVNPVMENYLDGEEKKIIGQKLDFIGYNCYFSESYDEWSGKSEAVYQGRPRTTMDWPITPDALYWAVRFLYGRYQLPVLITENGMANVDFEMSDGRVHDQQRIEYIKGYLKGLKRAAEEGFPIIGYQYWSVMDNFEWADGYDKRFGLIYVDYRTQKRIFKDSALWYAGVIRENGANL